MADDRTYRHDVFERFTGRWPEAGDRLLTPGGDTFLAQRADERNYRLIQGYKRAGDILIREALAEPYDRNSLVFPALFNYRHYIELALKAIIEDHGAFASVSLGLRNHGLTELWQSFTKIAMAFGIDCSEGAALAVGRCIAEFAKIDARAVPT